MKNKEIKAQVVQELMDMINSQIMKKLKKGDKEEEPKALEIEVTTVEPLENKKLSDLRRRLGK